MKATYRDAQKAADSIRKAVNPVSIFLFGSVAREGEGNDLDLLVLIDDPADTVEDAGPRVYRSLKPHYRKFSIDPFVISLSDWREFQKKGSPFLRLLAREGRVLFMKNAVEEWLRQAGEELAMARYLLQGGYFRGACYHAQQAVERTMKAGLLERGWELEKTHSAARLSAIGKDLRVKFPLSDEEILFIDGIYRGRYPVEAGLLPLGAPTVDEAEKSVKVAEKLLRSMQKKKRK
jgi:HEPN domain-containing protein/predicted nucleotidyltransferase